MDLQKEIDKLKVKSGYSGKSQQWQFGFDLACRELAKTQAVPNGFVLVPKEPTNKMLDAGYENSYDAKGFEIPLIYKAMIEAVEQAND